MYFLSPWNCPPPPECLSVVQVTGASAGNRELSAEFCAAIMVQSRRRRGLDLPLHRRRGRQNTDDFDNRVIGIELDDLLSLPRRLCVAGDANKTDAIRAVLKGGHATHLVTDMASTEQLRQDQAPDEW